MESQRSMPTRSVCDLSISLADVFDKFRGEEALVARHQPADLYADFTTTESKQGDHLRWTYNTLDRAVVRFTTFLTTEGIRSGDVVVTVLPNGVEWVVVALACLRTGCTFAALNARDLSDPEGFRNRLSLVKARLVVAEATSVGRLDALMQDMSHKTQTRVVSGHTDHSTDGWTPFSDTLDPALARQADDFEGYDSSDAPLLLWFTSGTTAAPKCCPHSAQSIKGYSETYINGLGLNGVDILCNTMPNNHGMGYIFTMAFLLCGSKVVFPGAAFDAQEAVSALQEEACTYIPLVPTMLYQLLNFDSNIGGRTSLATVVLGGATVSLPHMQDCLNKLGAKKVAISYAMSEACPARPTPSSDPTQFDMRDGTIVSGRVAPGTWVRVCTPGSTQTVSPGEIGELHLSGDMTISRYVGDLYEASFYELEGRRWYKTGDTVKIDENSRIAVVGRLKDIIVRGGENIAPEILERTFGQIQGLQSCTFGVEDDIAGEVPVVVYRGERSLVSEMHRLALSRHGQGYAPAHYIHLDDLGLGDFPRNSTGKIQKTALRQSVRDWKRAQHTSEEEDGLGDVQKHPVVRTWARTLGLRPEDLDLNAPVNNFADSITFLRFRSAMRRSKDIEVTRDVVSLSITDQIKLFGDTASLERSAEPAPCQISRKGPPGLGDMIHCQDDEARAARTREVVEAKLAPLGLDWSRDVLDVFPAHGLTQALFINRRPLSWCLRYAIVTNTNDSQRARRALRAAFANYGMFTSCFVRESGDDTDLESQALHVQLRSSERILDLCVSEGYGTVNSIDELIEYGDDESLDTPFGGLCTRAGLAYIKELDTFGIVINANHATYDLVALNQLFFPDLDAAFRDPCSLKPHVPFKVWAETYHSLSTSQEAQRSIDFHVQRLRGMEHHRKALFPPQRAPEWFWGPRRGWKPPVTTDNQDDKYENPTGQPLEAADRRSDDTGGIRWKGEFPALAGLKAAIPGVQSSTIAKAALALANAHWTGDSHALFSSLESGREAVPFVPAGLRPYVGLDCALVAGALYEWVLDFVEVDGHASLRDFLARLQATQHGQTAHSHAPVQAVARAMPPAAGAMYTDVMRRQDFNWVQGLGAMVSNAYENIRLANTRPRGDVGLSFSGGTGGADGSFFVLMVHWDDANVYRSEAERWLSDWQRAVEWIIEGGDVDRPLGGCLNRLRQTEG